MTSTLLGTLHWHTLLALTIAVVSVGLARLVLPTTPAFQERPLRPIWDLPVRAGSAVALVLLITALANRMGPTVSGVLAAFPIALLVVVAFTHAQQGASVAIAFLRSFITGMWSSAAFCSTIALAIAPLGKRVAFPLALAWALAVQAIVLRMLSTERQLEPAESTVLNALARTTRRQQ